MSKEFILSDEAVLDIEEAFLWYAKIDSNIADKFEANLHTIFKNIRLYPEGFQKRYKNVRVKFLKKFPYGVHYIMQNNSIIVVGVFHTSRNPKNWLKRIKWSDLAAFVDQRNKIRQRSNLSKKIIVICFSSLSKPPQYSRHQNG